MEEFKHAPQGLASQELMQTIYRLPSVLQIVHGEQKYRKWGFKKSLWESCLQRTLNLTEGQGNTFYAGEAAAETSSSHLCPQCHGPSTLCALKATFTPSQADDASRMRLVTKTLIFLEAGDSSLNPSQRTLPKRQALFQTRLSQTDLAERSGLTVRVELFPLGTVWQL